MKILKIATMIAVIVLTINIIQPKVYATKVSTFDQMKTSINNFLNKGKGGGTGIDDSTLKSVVNPVANILTAIGIAVLVAVTMIMGIKYMFATPEEAAKLKQQLIGLVVSGVVIFGAVAIWKIVYTVLNGSGI